MWRTRKAMLCCAALLSCVGLLLSRSPGEAQRIPGPTLRNRPPVNRFVPRKKLVPKRRSIVERVLDVPGRGPVKMRFLRLPHSALHKLTRSAKSGPGSSRFFGALAPPALDPILYSSASDYDNASDGLADALWTFPTIGYDASSNHIGIIYGIPNTLETDAPAANNTADIAIGELGGPAQVTQLVLYGGMADANSFTPQKGDVFIVMFDGVDRATPPVFQGNSAILRDLDSNNEPIDGYVITFEATDGFGGWIIDCIDDATDQANPYVINDPRGRFGLLVAKQADGVSSTSTQWVGLVNTPNGGNFVWQISGGDFGTVIDNRFDTGTDFNQGKDGVGAYNYFMEIHGTNLDGSTAQRGTLMGNIRRRGVNPPPVVSDGETAEEELAPGAYLVIAHDPTTGDVVRQDYLFTQPSYTTGGSLTINYKLEGYPAGTYDFEIRQIPVIDTNGDIDVVWDPAFYPFGDFVSATIPGVTITDGGTTKLSARLERLGDITGSSGVRDGIVDGFDLTPFAISFGLSSSDADFNPDADFVGDPFGDTNGLPDGFVDGYDLTAFGTEFFLGDFEEFNFPAP